MTQLKPIVMNKATKRLKEIEKNIKQHHNGYCICLRCSYGDREKQGILLGLKEGRKEEDEVKEIKKRILERINSRIRHHNITFKKLKNNLNKIKNNEKKALYKIQIKNQEAELIKQIIKEEFEKLKQEMGVE